jgi:redox-sensitive bicupin YhaK (pirin superfamily)
MSSDAILQVLPLGFPWVTQDPFLFCAWHDDAYPRGDANMAPAASLAGRDIGQDFSRKDGWSMYHGETVPGFPAHPHRGFETVTIVRKGLIDHSDSLGATARFGQGDVQWVTAGRGIVHSEMFPLLQQDADNPLELFQIWLNLPARNKMAQPHFTMLWSGDIPRVVDGGTEIAVVAGALQQGARTITPPAPPPDSWAAQPEADVAIWTIRQQPGARWTLPAASGDGTRRVLYLFRGKAQVAGRALEGPVAIELQAGTPVELATEAGADFLLLQGSPIGEPVAQYGPFVMNTQAEIMQAMQDYRRTQFGGWPFAGSAPVHGREAARFAKHPDGRLESPRT